MDFFRRPINKGRMHRHYLQTFNCPEGRAVLRDLCIEHGVLTNNFEPNPYKHALNAGERNVVLRIMTILGTEPEDLLTMSDEAREDYDG